MNRRGFLSSMLRAGVGAMILPGACTYGRKWVKAGPIIKPYWYQTSRYNFCYTEAYQRAWVNAFFYGHPFPGNGLTHAGIKHATAAELDQLFV